MIFPEPLGRLLALAPPIVLLGAGCAGPPADCGSGFQGDGEGIEVTLATEASETHVDECSLPCLTATLTQGGLPLEGLSVMLRFTDGDGNTWTAETEDTTGASGQVELCLDGGVLGVGDVQVEAGCRGSTASVQWQVEPFGYHMGRDREPGAPAGADSFPELVPAETPFLFPREGTWFAHQLSGPSWLDDGDGAWVAVSGTPEDNGDPETPNSYYIGMVRVEGGEPVAWSPDWILPAEEDGEAWDQYGQNGACLVPGEYPYTLYYHGVSTPDGGLSVGRAWSEDGWTWEPDPDNPVFSPTGSEEDFDGSLTGHPTVRRSEEGLLEMWYAGGRDIGFALSEDDGATWERYCGGAVISGGGVRLKTPEVVRVTQGSTATYWITWARGDEHAYEVRWAESYDGIRWEEASEPLLEPGSQDWDSTSVTNGQVLVQDDTLKVLYAAVGEDDSGVGLATEGAR